MLNKCIIALSFFCFYTFHIDAKHHHKNDKEKQFVITELESWSKAYNMHLIYANRYYDEAKAMCMQLCDSNKKIECYENACELVCNTQPSATILYALSSYLLTFGLDNIYEWGYIKDKLKSSAYHFDMAEFYKDLLHSTNSWALNNP